MNDIAQLIATYGLSIILSACFIWQYFSAVKHNETREDLLYQTIDTTLTEMQQNLAEIQKNMAVMLEKIEHMDTGLNE